MFGGVFDDEFAAASRKFLTLARRGRFTLLLSPLTHEELEDAPARVRGVVTGLRRVRIEIVPVSAAVVALRARYVAARVATPRTLADATHVAAATHAAADVLASWNFRDLVRFDKIRGYNAVNLAAGYGSIEIRSPRELIHDEEAL